MKILHTQSLAATVDAINESFFLNQQLSKPQRRQAAKWIADRQGAPGSYANMFAPTKRDMAEGIKLFTGERIATRAGTSHILGEEASRALILLKPQNREIKQALQSATVGMMGRLQNERRTGMYCCGKCSAALWRHLTVGGLAEADPERILSLGIKRLRGYRDGNGRWRVFPFHYTLLALSEIDLASSVTEMRYAAPVLERSLKRSGRSDKYARRRRILAERILAKC